MKNIDTKYSPWARFRLTSFRNKKNRKERTKERNKGRKKEGEKDRCSGIIID
jgi:hypothetical protein